MDLEKDHFDDETELSPLEEEDLGGDSDEIADAEEDLLVAGDASDEEEGTPAAKPAGKAAAKKPAAPKAAKKHAASKVKPKKALKKKAAKPKKKSKPKAAKTTKKKKKR